MTPKHTVLVIGCGSIGERHIRTFLASGRANIVACDNRPEICKHIGAAYRVRTVADWRAALRMPDITSAVVATPAPQHVGAALEILVSGRHVLIEKPLALELIGTDQLAAARDRAGKFAAVAYVNHCHPALLAARDFIQSGELGPVRHAVLVSGQHFPTFRPAYREIYYRDPAQGGGAIQDALTHMANAVEWILGPTTRVFCDASHQVLEGVDVEDTVSVAARNGPALVTYALNQFQAPNDARWDFHSQQGSVRVELGNNRWGILRLGETEWDWHGTPLPDRDALFRAQADAFLDGCEGGAHPLCTLEEGIQTLRFNVAALRSWQEQRAVELCDHALQISLESSTDELGRRD